MAGGGSAECWSLVDPDSGRGRQYDLTVIDEAGQVPELAKAWEQSIRPMLAARQGKGWFLSTPTGTQHYFHALFRKGMGVVSNLLINRDWKSWQMATSCNPFITATEIESMKADMSESAFAQEVQAQFITWEGAVFSRLRESIYTDEPSGQRAEVIGVDWAGSSGSGDYTAFVVLSGSGYVLEVMRLRGEPFIQQRARLKALWTRYGKPPVVAEENGMGCVQNSELRQADIPVQDFTTTSASKTQIISKLVQAFEQGTVHIPNDEALLAELQAFQCTPLAGGAFRYAAPPGLHDDLVMALAIAVSGLGDARARTRDREFLRLAAEANSRLTRSSMAGDSGDYLEGGGSGSGVMTGNPWSASRWTH